MKLLNLALSLILSAVAVALLSSCETSKIAYGNSYYFKQTPKAVVSNLAEAAAQETAVASIEKTVPATETDLAGKVERRIEQVKVMEEQQAALVAAEKEVSKSERKAIEKELKAERKALKKEVKALVKEYKKSPEKFEKQDQVSGNTRTGIILGAVGLILVIIGGGSVLWTIGTILLVVGLVLILLDVL
ncbi:MAG: hypothetical protein ACLFUB_08315 [Cyclobacteriaceae bacterium]